MKKNEEIFIQIGKWFIRCLPRLSRIEGHFASELAKCSGMNLQIKPLMLQYKRSFFVIWVFVLFLISVVGCQSKNPLDSDFSSTEVDPWSSLHGINFTGELQNLITKESRILTGSFQAYSPHTVFEGKTGEQDFRFLGISHGNRMNFSGNWGKVISITGEVIDDSGFIYLDFVDSNLERWQTKLRIVQ